MEALISKLNEDQLHLLLSIGENQDILKNVSETLIKTTPSMLSTPESKSKLEQVLNTYNNKKESLLADIKTIEEGSPILNKIVEKKPIRIYMDGVFDIIHSGHFNAIRQAKKLGDVLVVGINKDEDIIRAKGPTIMNDKERIFLASACKWGDEFVGYTPYTPNIKLLDELNCDYCAHGDDIVFDENGKSVYDEIIKAGRMKYFKRTEGVSTTEITGKLLYNTLQQEAPNSDTFNEYKKYNKPVQSKFLETSRRMALFSNNRAPSKSDKVVYFPGDFDLLGIGTIEALKKAKEEGSFVYAGIYSDELVAKIKGKNYPYLTINERTFNILALKYVDEVIVNPLYKISQDFLDLLNISVVFNAGNTDDDSEKLNVDGLGDPFEIPKKNGIYKYAKVEHDISNKLFEERIFKQKETYLKKFIKKSLSDEKCKELSTVKMNEI